MTRSAAEQEIRDAVVARLRQWRPEARICHEVNVSSMGPNRMDVIAVSPAEIIAVEIKSKRDTLTRAPKQIEAMRRCAHHVAVAMHEKHLIREPAKNEHVRHEKNAAGEYLVHWIPDEVKRCTVWVHPEPERRGPSWAWRPWSEPRAVPQSPLPSGALHMLWRAELAWLCQHLGLAAPRRANMGAMVRLLRWHATGAQITQGICAALRNRAFPEADEAVPLPPVPGGSCAAHAPLPARTTGPALTQASGLFREAGS